MKKRQYCTGTNTFKSVVLPIVLIISLLTAVFCFNKFFVDQPQEKAEYIEQLIVDGNYAGAVDLLCDFSYKEYSSKETLRQICEGRSELMLYSLNIGDTLYFGKYEQDNNWNNGAESIEWRVLDKDGRRLLIQTTKVIEEKAYHEYYVNNREGNQYKWADTSLYSFLNGDFYSDAFNDSEKNLILESKYGSVFIADPDMCSEYTITNISAGEALPTDYVLANYNPDVKDDGMVEVWLMGRMDSQIYHREKTDYYANSYHWITRKGGYHYDEMDLNGIRPVMWISVASLLSENTIGDDNK